MCHVAGNRSVFYQQDISIPSGFFLLQQLTSIWEAQEGKMGRKTRSAEKEGNHRSGVLTLPRVSIAAACLLHKRAVALRAHGQYAEAATVPNTPHLLRPRWLSTRATVSL
jgi:hypothetical protein